MSFRRLMALGTIAVLVLASLAFAGANTKNGKTLYRANCRVCHDGKSAAPALAPNSKTITQWQKAFAKGGPVASHCVGRVKEKTGKVLSEQDLADIAAYAVGHAADSDQPATCG